MLGLLRGLVDPMGLGASTRLWPTMGWGAQGAVSSHGFREPLGLWASICGAGAHCAVGSLVVEGFHGVFHSLGIRGKHFHARMAFQYLVGPYGLVKPHKAEGGHGTAGSRRVG